MLRVEAFATIKKEEAMVITSSMQMATAFAITGKTTLSKVDNKAMEMDNAYVFAVLSTKMAMAFATIGKTTFRKADIVAMALDKV
jgi:hypothetical protein